MSARLKVRQRPSAAPAPKAKGRRSRWDGQDRQPGGRAFGTLSRLAEPGAASVPAMAEAPEQAPPAEAAAAERARDPRLERLVEAAAAAREPLPERATLESALGASLGPVQAARGPRAREALDGIGAEAATVGNVVVLRDGEPDKETLAHEAIHVLQGHDAQDAPAALTGPAAPVELEADELSATVAEAMRAERSAGIAPQARLASGLVARRDLRAGDESEAAFDEASEAPAAAEEPPQSDTPEAEAAPAPAGEPSVLGEQPEAALEPTNEPEFEPAAPPDVSLSPEEAAARKAEMDAAKAAIAGADDVDALMASFAGAPPSMKARLQGELAGRADGLAQNENRQFDQKLPTFHAQMSGDVEVTEPPALDTGAGKAAGSVEGALAPTPEPDIAPTDPAVRFAANDNIEGWFATQFDADPERAVGESIGSVQTRDREVDTSPGPPPTVPLEGETDPKRVDDQQKARQDEAIRARDAEIRKVVEGRGPEASQPKPLDEAFTAMPQAVPALAGAQPVAGADAYVAYGLPEEVEAAVDAKHGEAMRASLDGARTAIDESVATRDTEREAAVADAETQRDELNKAADVEQARAVGAARTEIQTARKDAVTAQNKAVETFDADAAKQRRTTGGEIDGEVARTEGQVRTEYQKAEKDANKKVEKANADAEEAKRKDKEKAKKQSWWQRAKGFVKKALKALTSVIGKIFDKVRSLVKGLLDKVKALAKKLIDLAAAAIKKAIRVFGEILKGLVDTLLGDLFPELAKALNDRIDSAVATAEAAVDAAAETLKKGVDAIVGLLGKVLDKIILAFQTAVSAGLALAYGALTGDWGEAARIVLEPLLELLGIDKEEFYSYVGRASETISLIVDSPGTFVGNLWTAFTTGVGYFRDNFFEHLKNGVISWLSGTLGGVFQLPKTFDVIGILDLGRQVIGLTFDLLRRIAVRVFGEKAVETVEFVMTEVAALIKGGWDALWTRVSDAFSDLVDLVLGKMKEFVVGRLIIAAFEKLASLFTPIGALVQLVFTIWNIIMFLKDQFSRIITVLRSLVDTIVSIARGLLEPAAKGVEMALANSLPLAIDLVAKLARLGGIPGKIREILGSIRKRIEDAVVGLFKKIAAGFKGLFKGKGGPEKPGEALPVAGAPAPIQVGQRLTVETPDGAHTVWFAVEGRDATLMLASTPVPLWQTLVDLGKEADEMEVANDDTKKKRRKDAIEAVATAKAMRKELDAEADAVVAAVAGTQPAAATPAPAAAKPKPAPSKPAAGTGGAPGDAAVTKKQESLRDVLVRAYKALGKRIAPAILEKFKAEIEQLHPDAQTTVLDFLIQKVSELKDADWAAVEKRLKAEAPLFLKPLLKQGAVKYSTGLRAAIVAHIAAATGETGFDPVRANVDAFLSNNYLAKLHEGTGEVFAPALAAIQSALLKNEAYATTAARLNASLLQAARGASTEEPDPELKAIGGPAVPEFLEEMAQHKDYKGLAAAKWDPRWWGHPPNQDWIRDKFRLGGGEHEWIPTNYVGEVIARAREEMKPGQDAEGAARAAGAAVRWARFQNRFRSPTKFLIYKPEGDALREITDYPGPKGRVPKVAVLQGHVGAVYAPISGGKYVPPKVPGEEDPSRIKQQTQSQSGWHDDLRTIFDENKGVAGDVDAVPRILKLVLAHYTKTVWSGATAVTGNGPTAFDEYYDSVGGRLSYGALEKRQTTNFGSESDRLSKVIDKLDDPNG